MDDDFNTPQALGVLFDLTRLLYAARDRVTAGSAHDVTAKEDFHWLLPIAKSGRAGKRLLGGADSAVGVQLLRGPP